MQGLAVLFSGSPEVSELQTLLDDYEVSELADASDWPMGGPGLAVAYRPEVNGICSVDVCDRVWPDDMGDPKTSPELFAAWTMGFFGPGAFPGGLGRAVQQSYSWPDAEDAVPRHRAFVRLRVSYIHGAGPDAKVAPADYDPVAEFAWLVRVARRLLDHPQALCFFNPNGEVLLDATGLDTVLARADESGLPPLDAGVNVRFWGVDDEWKLADTVGLAQFDQPDHEVSFRRGDHTMNDIACFPLNVALYLLKKPGAIRTGHTVDGPGGKWRAEERAEPLQSPPRSVLHWTLDGAPQPPAALRNTTSIATPTPANFPTPEEIRRRSIAWLRGPDFAAVYGGLHASRGLVALAMLFRPLQASSIYRGAGRHGSASAARWRRYQELPEKGDVLLAHMIICNTAFADQATQRVPCMALASFDPDARPLVAQLADRMGALYTGDEPGDGETPLLEIVQDDEYMVWARRLLPAECTGGVEIYTFNVMACADDLSADTLAGAPFVLFAERGPSGATVVVPWKIATSDFQLHPKSGGPPPLPKGPPPLP